MVIDPHGRIAVVTEPLRVVLADDHELLRSGLRLELGDGFDVVGEADDVGGAIDVINARVPDLVICDLHMPRGGGVAVVQKCALLCPIVILTVSEAESDLLDAVAAGAAGYLLKTTPIDELRASFKGPRLRASPCSPPPSRLWCSVSSAASPRQPTRIRSPSGSEVLQLVARGRTYKEIGVELGISPKTAENHVRNILGKLHLSRRSDLVLRRRARTRLTANSPDPPRLHRGLPL